MFRMFILLALAALAAAYQGPMPTRVSSKSIVMMSRFKGKMWDMDAKKEIFAEWDADKPRDYDNFNPFERDSNGNCCDPSGKFPGEGNYQDPMRPEANWETMQRDRAIMDEINKDPRMAIKGKPGNWKYGWDKDLGMIMN